MAENPTYEELEKRIQELERAESKRKWAEEEKDRILNLSCDLICIAGMDGYFKYVNPAWEKTLGYTREELLSKPFLDFIYPDDHLSNDDEVEKLNRGEQTLDFENRYLHKDGSILTISWTATPLEHEKNMYCIGRNITDRKRAEKELSEERVKSQHYLDIAGVIFVAIDAEQNVMMINKKGCEILGYDEHEIVGKNWFDQFIKAEYVEEIKSVYNQIMSGNIEPVEYYENEIFIKNGEERIIAWHNSIIRDESGRIVGTLSSGDDITERKQAEEALSESEKRYRHLVNHMSDGLVVQDENEFITYANNRFCKILGYQEDEIIGMAAFDFLDENNRKILKKQMSFRKKGITTSYEIEVTRKDGSKISVFLSPQGVFDLEGQFKGSFTVFTDITVYKQAKEALEKANERLEEKVKERTTELKERNIALKVLLEQRKNDKKQLEKIIMSNIKQLIKPNLVRLKKSSLTGRQKSELTILEANLNEIISPFESSLSSEYLKLTPTEIQVANFIKHNVTSKEIANSMGLSRRTIDTHRHNIRKKIGIRGKGINLKTYLSSLT